MARLLATCGLLSVVLALCGCGTPVKYAIKGTVTRGGEKLTWPDGGHFMVIFFPEDRQKNPEVYSAQTDLATSTYTIAAIPAGKYAVAVQQFDTKFMDALNAAYDPSKTKLVYEVAPQDGQTIDIDLPAGDANHPRRRNRQENPEQGQGEK